MVPSSLAWQVYFGIAAKGGGGVVKKCDAIKKMAVGVNASLVLSRTNATAMTLTERKRDDRPHLKLLRQRTLAVS